MRGGRKGCGGGGGVFSTLLMIIEDYGLLYFPGQYQVIKLMHSHNIFWRPHFFCWGVGGLDVPYTIPFFGPKYHQYANF